MAIPSTEIIWKTFFCDDAVYYITSKKARDYYFIYKSDGKAVTKLGKDENPKELENKYIKEDWI